VATHSFRSMPGGSCTMRSIIGSSIDSHTHNSDEDWLLRMGRAGTWDALATRRFASLFSLRRERSSSLDLRSFLLMKLQPSKSARHSPRTERKEEKRPSWVVDTDSPGAIETDEEEDEEGEESDWEEGNEGRRNDSSTQQT
ncbi:hypothetical protein PFISCL1PPCAC_26444, partial [Pristionchus fissidentatus]